MSTIGIVRDLAEIFLWVGIAGAVLASLCAVAVGIALAAGSAGFAGGAGAVWIGGALLSLTSGFSGQWLPALAAAGALIAALVLGPVARAVLRRIPARPKPERAIAEPAPAAPASAAPASPPRMVGVRTVASESIR